MCVIRIDNRAQALGVELEEGPREAHCCEIVGSFETFVRTCAVKFENFVHPLIGTPGVEGLSPWISQGGGINAFVL